MHCRIGFIVILLLIFHCSCTQQSNRLADQDNSDLVVEIDMEDTVKNNEMLVYIIPSPFQASTLLKTLDIEYSSELLGDVNLETEKLATSHQKAISLGFCLVEMGYAHIYEQYPICMDYLVQTKTLMEDLGLDTPREIAYLNRVEKNLQNEDSLRIIFSDYKRNFDANFVLKRDKKIGLLVLSGFYLESLHHIVYIYENYIDHKDMDSFMARSLNSTILQQRVLLNNLVELLDEFEDVETRKLISQLNLINQKFDEMNITYNIDENTDRIVKVNFNASKLTALQSIITRIKLGITS